MVVEQQDSGVCLSTEPGSPSSDDPAESRACPREGGSIQGSKLSGLVDGLERLRTSNRKMEDEETGEASGEREEEFVAGAKARGLRLSDTMPDLSGGWGEENEEGVDKDERGMDGGGRGMAGVSCHHHLLLALDDQDDDNGPRLCQICR